MKNGHTTREKAPAGRYALLDELRGLDLISMMLFHVCWDLVFLFDMNMGWYAGTPGRLWQQAICCPASVRPLGGTCCGAVLPCLPPERW